jgi:hypothetical protein
MSSAAEMPLPETSAMTNPSRREGGDSMIGKASKKSPPISRAGW